MKTQITIIIAIILALPLVFAMYGGESEELEFSFETDNCTITPNETEGIEFTFYDNKVLVEPAINYVGQIDITCYDWLEREQTESYKGSGGGDYIYPGTKPKYQGPVPEGSDEEHFRETGETIEEQEPETIIEPEEKSYDWTLLLTVFGVIIFCLIVCPWLSFRKKN